MTSKSASFFVPKWPAPANVKSYITQREYGFSEGGYASNNLALHVDDEPESVAKNRSQLESAITCDSIQWLDQVHGRKIIEAQSDGFTRTADGCYSRVVNQACAVLTADCLPVLLCDKSGTQVAAVHAGWRGLSQGIVSSAVDLFDCDVDDLLVYLGPAISSEHFEVGIDVLEAFFESAKTELQLSSISRSFIPSLKHPMKFQADIYVLAKAELNMLGVTEIYGGESCTYSEAERFYSYRRDGQTGRFASLIWLT
jgi:YfiH family protein